MKRKFLIIVFYVIMILVYPAYSEKNKTGDKKDLLLYLNEHRQKPADYVIDKFKTHDFVIIGEPHRVKHQVNFVKDLIPKLYKNGIYNLGMEFGSYEVQKDVDKLITAEEYDKDLARSIMFRNSPTWGYNEYLDIYREAWKLNRSLPEDKPKFRIVNLCYTPNWSSITEEEWKNSPRRKIMNKVWNRGDYDEHMAEVVIKEFADKGQKALLYCGTNHGFTRYHQPVYDYKDDKIKFYKFNKSRMGNILYDKMPDRVFFIVFHSPWGPLKRQRRDFRLIYQVEGVIDELMREINDKEVGFDVKNTPFGKLTDNKSSYSVGYDNFKLEDFCDGYIFLKQFDQFEGCTADPKFITEKNFREAVMMLHPLSRKNYTRPSDLLDVTKNAADFPARYPYLR